MASNFNNSKCVDGNDKIILDRDQINPGTESLSDVPWQEGITIRNLCYAVNGVDILSNVDLHLPSGQIYGLLGPSGCGKTSLLRCLVGLNQPEVGDIFLFGYRPSDHRLGIPGQNVGYMPQEIALHENLSVKENVNYFASISGLEAFEIKTRFTYLSGLFELTEPTKLVRYLSGGQKRRVSLVCSLIHRPRLIILDEPTAGVDPLLRERCWNHLIGLASQYKVTIIITTHYIEEARRAHRIGFMRKGRLIIEDEPNRLMSIYQSTNLEQVFLTLCTIKRKSTIQNPRDLKIFQQRMSQGYQQSMKGQQNDRSTEAIESIENKMNVFRCLLVKTLQSELRDPLSLALQYFVPIWILGLFYACIGGPAIGLKLGILDLEPYSFFFTAADLFVDSISSPMFIKVKYYYQNESMADARARKIWGVLRLPSTFTDTLLSRNNPNLTLAEAQAGQATLHSDMSDRIVAMMAWREIQAYFQEFYADSLRAFNKTEKAARDPVWIADSIYGHVERSNYSGYRKIMFPGFLINCVISMTVAITSISLINLRNNQTYERTCVAGVSRSIILGSYALVRILLNLPFIILGAIIPTILFQADYPYNAGYAGILIFTQIFLGTWLGVTLAGASKEVMGALYTVSGLFIILLFTTGSLWPIESIPLHFRWICRIMPGTGTIEAYRSLLYRGWSLIHPKLWPGLVIDFGWIVFLILIGHKFYK